MSYGHPYVARVALGAKDVQTVNAFKEAESYHGVSVIVAYSHCIAHGYEMADALVHQSNAVDTGYWPLFRYDPRKIAAGESPLKMDSPAPKLALNEFLAKENRFRQVALSQPEQWKIFLEQAQQGVQERYALYEHLARAMGPKAPPPGGAPPKA